MACAHRHGIGLPAGQWLRLLALVVASLVLSEATSLSTQAHTPIEDTNSSNAPLGSTAAKPRSGEVTFIGGTEIVKYRDDASAPEARVIPMGTRAFNTMLEIGQPPASGSLEASEQGSSPLGVEVIGSRAGNLSQVSDPNGDLARLEWLFADPYARGAVTWGTEPYWRVPTSLIGNPSSFYWRAWTKRPSAGYAIEDAVPDSGTSFWQSGATSFYDDDEDPQLEPHHDLLGAEIGPAVSSHIQFEWQLRGVIPGDFQDVVYEYGLWDGSNANWNWFVWQYINEYGVWAWAVNAVASSFPWHSAGFEDILYASVSDVGQDQLRLEMEVAATIPSIPLTDEGEPRLSWYFDTDDNPSTGNKPFGADACVRIQFDSESQVWRGTIMRWEYPRFVEQSTASFERNGSRVVAVVNRSDLDLSQSYRWQVVTGIRIGQPDEKFISTYLDIAPDPGDVNPPSITNFRESADPINRQGCPAPNTVDIRADITDSSGVSWARLYYQPPEGSWGYADMMVESGSTYKAALGPFSQAGTLSYYIKARGNVGNEVQSESETVTVDSCANYCSDFYVQGFDPERDGLKFQNFLSEGRGGACTGMSLTVLDYFLTQYLRQLRRAGRGLSHVNAAQSGQLLEDARQYNWLRLFRKHFDGFGDVLGATAQRLEVQNAAIRVIGPQIAE